MAWKWFIQKEDFVDGPLSTADVQTRIQVGQLQNHHLIWGRGLEQWLSVAKWTAQLSQLGTQSPENAAPEAWHYAVNGQAVGPISREALIRDLKGLPAIGGVMLWTKGMKEWAPVFEFHDILTEVGVNKRQFPRADLTGKAILKGAGTTLTAPLVSISEGGFGIQLDSGVVSGQILAVELHSPAFRDVLHAKAEVRYAGHGVFGMKFTQVSVETKGAIIQFVRQSQVRFTLRAA